uniref:Ig-like domain-containing protein n=1 Tax=Cyprinus carpio carpio TaxID=630221 RepID=A0A8C1AQ36_CYPCA
MYSEERQSLLDVTYMVKESLAGNTTGIKKVHSGSETEGSRWSHVSDEVTLTVSDPRAVLSVSPQTWLTEGDPLTLICQVHSFFTGWTFSWFTLTVSAENSRHYNLLSDSSRGAGGNYTVISAALNHTGAYVCRAERWKSVYKTQFSNTQLLCITGVSPPVTLIVSPSRTQHFTYASLSLNCEDQSNSNGWRVRRYTDDGGLEDCSSLRQESQTGSTCTISSTVTSDTGVYWCESESGANHHPVNITVHSGVILESPVHPLTEGDNLILRCLYQHNPPSNLRVDFYKDGSLIQNQTTEMSIATVSKSHEGFYYCKHPTRGESPKSWISVRASTDSRSDGLNPMITGVTAGLTVAVLIIVFLVLLWCYRNVKDSVSGPTEHIYDEIELKSATKQKKKKEKKENETESSDCFYSKVTLQTDHDSKSGPTEHIYDEIELKSATKQKKKKGNKDSESGPTEHIYDEIELKSATKQKKKKEKKGAASSHVTYAQVT